MIIDNTMKHISSEDFQELQHIYYFYEDKPINQTNEIRKKWQEIRKKFINDCTAEEIKAEIAEVLKALTLKDFEEHQEQARARLNIKDTCYTLKEYGTSLNFINASDFVYNILSFYINSIVSKHELLEEVEDMIEQKVLEWYKRPTEEDIQFYISIYDSMHKQPPKPVKEIIYPLDRVTKKLFEVKNVNDRYKLNILTGKDKEAGVIVSFIIPDGATSIKLTNYDKLVYIIVSSLYYAGNKQITSYMIFKAMGIKDPGKVAQNQKDRLNKSLTNLGFARIQMNNKGEINAGYKYDLFNVDDEALLNFQRSRIISKGKETTVINLLSDPVLLRFSRQRGQFTTFGAALLQDNLNNTEINIELKSYLLDYISHAQKNKKLSKKILFDTICSKFDISNDRKAKKRFKDKINTLLSFYQKEGFIKKYRFDQDNNIYFDL